MQSARRRLHAANGLQAVTDFTDEELWAMPMPGEAARDANAHIVAAPAAAAPPMPVPEPELQQAIAALGHRGAREGGGTGLE